MISSKDIIWEAEPETESFGLKHNGKVSNRSKNTSKKKSVQKSSIDTLVNKAITAEVKLKNNKLPDALNDTETGVTLKDLNQEDKQKIAQLIHELAKVGEEKENIVHELNDERLKFFTQVRNMEEEKKTLMNKQQFLAEEVKQCQTLLQYYQNLITMQQTSLMTKEESKSHQNSFSSDYEKSKRRTIQEEVTTTSTDDVTSQSDEIRVNEVHDVSSANSSVTEDDILRMSDRQYKTFLKRKKDKLKKEQDSLRKLLLMKESSESEYRDCSVSSPVRNVSNKSTSPISSIKKRSIPIQTLSPITMNKNSSYNSPMRSTSKKCYKSSRLHSGAGLSSKSSPEKILHLLSQDLDNDSLQDLRHSVSNYSKPFLMQETNLGSLPSDMSTFSANTLTLDDSQILQDIFFVV